MAKAFLFGYDWLSTDGFGIARLCVMMLWFAIDCTERWGKWEVEEEGRGDGRRKVFKHDFKHLVYFVPVVTLHCLERLASHALMK